MKKLLISAIILLLFVSFGSYAQEKPAKAITKISIQDLFIQSGSLNANNSRGSLADFWALAPASALLANNLSGFTTENVKDGMNDNAVFSISLGLRFSDKQKTAYRTNPLLRLGLSYFSGANLSCYLQKETSKAFDTLTSSQTGQDYYIDSVTTEFYNMNYHSGQLRLEGSLIFRTNPEARWTLYTGVGISAGLSINSNTNINYNSYSRIENQNTDNTSFSYYSSVDSKNDIEERFSNKNNFGFSAFVPLGVDFRIGKKRDFWKMLHLFIEVRPGINLVSIPQLRTLKSAGVQQGFGLRVNWD